MLRRDIRTEIEEARSEFRKLLNSLSDEDLNRKSKNPGWTNREILFHMFLGFQVVVILLPLAKFFSALPKGYAKLFADVLNFSTPLFNFSNAIGARMGGRILNKKSLEKRFDAATNSLLKKLDRVKEEEWEMGMYYPHKWDGLFDKYMTTEKLFRYPTKHFNFHLKQISM